ncbi:zinc metallopeptidase [Metallumcola ferriviriculae]|uniref:Zinc metallopeptidase n=1 Tax=Metallumcola ferriviriculae TaxID=3039180 RepID=A0AAU0UP74_9FIRM|nr:zinc metallopeptidase [Desulfitibacteraceae bacterium MK1]
MFSFGFFPFLFGDWTFIILIPGIILAGYAQTKVQRTFNKYLKVRSEKGFTGAQVAKALLDRAGLDDVRVEMINGKLSDHYDPRQKVLRLSPQVYQSNSLASIGVAAHETGHALQHDHGYLPLQLRANLVPFAQFGSSLSFPLLLIGIFMSVPLLIQAGIVLFSAAVLFQIVTLPVEFNASSRAIAQLESNGFISQAEVGPTKKVLDAAALTYLAAALMAVLNLVRLILLARMYGDD